MPSRRAGNAKLEDAIAIGPNLVQVGQRAVMSDPAAKETRAIPQTVHPLNIKRLSVVAGDRRFVFMGSFSFMRLCE
jgi:hypothetical protein